MVRNLETNIETILEQAKFILRDATIESITKIQFDSNNEIYDLEGFLEATPNLLEIVAIEGETEAGEYVTEEDLDSTYYGLESIGEERIVPQGYGNATGKVLYDRLKITFTAFRGNSDVIIRYRWFNPNIIPVLTDFQDGSVLKMLLLSIFTNMEQKLKLVDYDLNNFQVSTATSDGLLRLADMFSIEEDVGIASEGSVLITNNGTTAYTVNTDTRFGVINSNGFITFRVDDTPGIYIINPGQRYVPVICTQVGTIGNVGAHSITEIFIDSNLNARPANIIVTNPASIPSLINNVIVNTPNPFDSGLDEDNDASIREKIKVRANATFGTTFDGMTKALRESPYIKNSLIHTFESNKDVLRNSLRISIVPNAGALSSVTLSDVQADINKIVPIGTDFTLEGVTSAIVDIVADVYVNVNIFGNTDSLEETIINNLSNYIDNATIGQDLYSSRLITIITNSTSVINTVLNKINVTEFVALITDYKTNASEQFYLSHDDPSDDAVVLQEIGVGIIFNSIQKKELVTYTAGSNTITTDEENIDTRVSPRVTLGLEDYNGDLIIDPKNKRNYYGSATNTALVIIPDAFDLIDSSYNLVGGETLLLDYNYFEDLTLDGVRISLEAQGVEEVITDEYAGQPVEISVWEGDSYADAVVVPNTSVQGIIDQNNRKLYEFEFASTVSFDSTKSYWLKLVIGVVPTPNPIVIVSHGTIADNYINRNPNLYTKVAGEDAESTGDRQINFQTYHKSEGAEAYQTINISNNATIPEVVKLGNVDLTFYEAIDR